MRVTLSDVMNLAAKQVPVYSHDWLDYLSAISGLVGACLAALAIWYAAWQAAQSKKDLIRERRLEFELGLLAKIRHQMSITQFQHLSGFVAALVVNASDETDIPVLRAAVGTKSGPVGRGLLDAIANDDQGSGDKFSRWLVVAQEEVDAAIQRRIEK